MDWATRGSPAEASPHFINVLRATFAFVLITFSSLEVTPDSSLTRAQRSMERPFFSGKIGDSTTELERNEKQIFGAPSISPAISLVAGSLCPGQEKRTMRSQRPS